MKEGTVRNTRSYDACPIDGQFIAFIAGHAKLGAGEAGEAILGAGVGKVEGE